MPQLVGTPAKYAFMLACALGLSGPSSCDAGVIPWAYDAIFGPVGSLHRSYYTPYYSGYAGSGYLPASYSYGSSTNGCSSCIQSAYYVSTLSSCGCSPIGSVYSSGGCSSGNCATGNCVVNSAPTGTLSPSPDPYAASYGASRTIEERLNDIERHLNLRSGSGKGEKTRGYDDTFRSSNPGSRSNRGIENNEAPEDLVRPRDNSLRDPATYREPAVRQPAGTGNGTRRDLFEENENSTSGSGTSTPFGANRVDNSEAELGKGKSVGSQKESVTTGKANTEAEEKKSEKDTKNESTDDSKSEDAKSDSTSTNRKGAGDLTIPARAPAPTTPIVEEGRRPDSLQLDSRVTSKAVSPRERQVITTVFTQPVIAKKKKPAPVVPAKPNWAGNSKSTDLAQHR